MGLENNPHENLELLGVRYLPKPKYIPTGVLAAEEIFPFANDGTHLEHYFQANGVTLATENRFGEVVYFHGNATIRVSEPEPGIPIRVPERTRTNEMREKLFSMNRFAGQRTLPDIPRYPEEITGIEVTRTQDLSLDEMGALVEALGEDPMDANETLRTYRIERTIDRRVLVRQEWHSGTIENGSAYQAHKGPGRDEGSTDEARVKLENGTSSQRGTYPIWEVTHRPPIKRWSAGRRKRTQIVFHRGL